jgi:DNA-binding cell septation regulator SpoVG
LSIEVTAVRIYPFDTSETGGHVRAMAEIEVNGCLTIRGFRIIESKHKGLFIGLPSRKGKDSRFHETVSILNKETEILIREKILEAFRTYRGPSFSG